MVKKNIFLIISIIFFGNAFCQTYPNNEDGQYEDMLTPEYYNTPSEGAFRLELNKFVHFANQLPFQHPLEDSLGQSPTYSIHRGFGDGIGPGGMGSHHPAFDYYIGSASTLVDMYAAYGGYVTINKNVDRYRHYLSITTDIQDSSETVIGKMVTLYGHIDLDLDSAANLDLDGQHVNKGDLVSKHLYSGTVGGPHLHFEIRYYRNTDSGIEDFYGGPVGDKTSISSGDWSYGYWNPNVGYGFAHPLNHLNSLNTSLIKNSFTENIKVYPNPTKGLISIEVDNLKASKMLAILNMSGRLIYRQEFTENEIVNIDLKAYERGIYLVSTYDSKRKITTKIFKE